MFEVIYKYFGSWLFVLQRKQEKEEREKNVEFFWRLQNFSTHDKCAHAKKKLNQKHHETVRIWKINKIRVQYMKCKAIVARWTKKKSCKKVIRTCCVREFEIRELKAANMAWLGDSRSAHTKSEEKGSSRLYSNLNLIQHETYDLFKLKQNIKSGCLGLLWITIFVWNLNLSELHHSANNRERSNFK